MKIACVIHSLDGGGAERVMAGLASRLAGRGHTVTLITLDDGARERHPVAPEVERIRLDVMFHQGSVIAKWSRLGRRIRRLRRALRDCRPDAVLSFCDRTNILTLFAAWGLGLPVVVSERSDPQQQQLGPIREWMRRGTYRRAATVVALTLPTASYFRGWLSVPIVVIPSAVEAAPERSDRARAAANKRIVGMGRLEVEKGFDRLIEAFAQIVTHSPKASGGWELRIFGEGSLRDAYQQSINARRLTNRICLAGWTDEPWRELADATIFALPSRYEGFPSALLEAMAAGVPSLSVDCPSGPRAIVAQSGTEGIVAQSGPEGPVAPRLVANETHALADGLLDLMKDDSQREELGRVGVEVASRFGWDEMVSRYERVLSDVAR